MSKSTTRKSKPFTKYGAVMGLLLTGVSLVFASIILAPRPAVAADMIVYKSPTCGCCKKWVSHLKKNGYTVEVHNQRNMSPIKSDLGVPRRLQSCHTAKVGGYVVEGHVPADLIARMLKEKPQIKGLAVPGMPMGSPGMEGPRKDAYDVISFQEDGRTSVYASR